MANVIVNTVKSFRAQGQDSCHLTQKCTFLLNLNFKTFQTIFCENILVCKRKKSLFLSVGINFVRRNSPFLTLAVVIEGATGEVLLFSSKFETLMFVLMNKKCIFES